MKKIYQNLIFILVAALFAVGCTEDITSDEAIKDSGVVKTEFMTVYASLESNDDATTGESRTTLDDNGDGGEVCWSEGDVIGAISEDGTITKVELSSIEDGYAKFSVPTDTKYAVYPYLENPGDATISFITDAGLLGHTLPSTVTLDGSNRVFDDGENVMIAHLTDDILAFKNLCGVLEIKLKGTQTVKHIALRSNTKDWDQTLSGLQYIDLSDANTPKIKQASGQAKTWSYINATCEDVVLNTSEATSFYLCVPPRTYKNLNICVQTDKGSYSITSKNSVVVNRSRIRPLAAINIDALAPATTIDLSTDGIANCYIVPQGSEAQHYSFPAQKLNSEEKLTDVAYAHIVWSEGEQLVSNVCYNASTGKVSFKYEGNNAEGNATIAVFNSSNQALWTWHIWCTDTPQKIAVANTSVNRVYGILDRNLGATYAPTTEAEAQNISEKDATASMGLYYQYGRPMPFPKATSIKNTTAEATAFGSTSDYALMYGFDKMFQQFVYSTYRNSRASLLNKSNIFGVVSFTDATAASLSETQTTCTSFCKDPINACSVEARKESWHSENETTVSAKGNTDPCPAGYVLDCGHSYQYFIQDLSTYKQVAYGSTENSAYGYYYKCPTAGGLVWIPAAGFRYANDTSKGGYTNLGKEFHWWAVPNIKDPAALYTQRATGETVAGASSIQPVFVGYTNTASALNVRCRAISRADLQAATTVSVFSGEGTEASPYLIKTKDDLVKLSGLCDGSMIASGTTPFNSAHYALAANINMSGTTFNPITSFSGSFDGKIYTISNLTVTPQNNAPTGLFGEIENATIKNVTVTNGSINVTAAEQLCTGGIAGKATYSTISNCDFSGTIASAATASFTCNSGINGGSAVVAGIVGYSLHSNITECTYSGILSSAKGQFAAGIVAQLEGGKVSKCSVSGNAEIASTMNHVGGIAARMGLDAEISECKVEVPVYSKYAIHGGIVGRMQSGTISKCVVSSDSAISGHRNNASFNNSYRGTGGIVGMLETAANGTIATIKDCACYADVTAHIAVGGIVGEIRNTPGLGIEVVIENCLFQGSLETTLKNNYNYSMSGGISGCVNNGYEVTPGKLTIKNCASLINGIKYISEATSAGIGGVLGYAKYSTIENCYSNLSVTDIVDETGAPITGSTITLYGGLYGVSHAEYPTIYTDCYYLSTGKRGADRGTLTLSNVVGLTLTQMTDGTLLNKLNASATVFVANSAGYPIPSSVPANTGTTSTVAKTRVSIIGDSISTFDGWMAPGYAKYYPITTNPTVISASQTYWYKLIYNKMSNAKLEKNIAWSGTLVTRSTNTAMSNQHWYGHSFVERFVADGMGNPDVIILHGGTNDVGSRGGSANANVKLHPSFPVYHATGYDASACPSDAQMTAVFNTADAATTRTQIEALTDTSFVQAYVKLLSLMHQQYPDAKVVMIIGDWIPEGTRQAIQKIAAHYGTKYGYKCVDLQNISPFQTYEVIPKEDGCHPNEAGFEVMANYIYEKVGTYID